MFEETEDPWDLFSEIKTDGEDWRAEHLDLPVTLLFLSRIKRALAEMDESSSERELWGQLKARGQSLARRRDLFVAAEAVGHLRRGAQVEEREAIRKALGVVVNEGTTLHKVHALRALRFVSSDECIPILEKGLQDRSPWVQATALHVIFHMNLRQMAPRKVLTDFLFDTFHRQTKREVVLNSKAVVKNFYMNKGLFVGLLKVPGGKRLAFLSLRLWITSTLLTVLLVLWAAAVAVFGALRVVAVAVFIKLPRIIISTPNLARRTLAVIYRIFIYLPYKILFTPLRVRKIKMSAQALGEPYFYLALLDYVFIYLLIVAGLPHGVMFLALFLGGFGLLLAASGAYDDRRRAERFRWFIRCAGAALLARYTHLYGQDDRLTLAFYLLAAVPGVWVMLWLARGFATVVASIALFLWQLLKRMREVATTDGKDAVETLWDKIPPGKELLSGAASRTGRLLRVLWQSLRPRLKKLSVIALVVGLLLTALYYSMRGLEIQFSDAKKLVGPELGDWLVSLKPLLYFVAGGLIMAIPCALLLVVFHLFWDELLIVERVRIRLRSKNPRRFGGINDFIAYVFHVVRNQTLSTGLRVRAALALTQVPLASQAYVNQLTDLAEEDLPTSVSDAVSQVAEDAETRRKRGQLDTFEIDMELINRQLKNIWNPGEVLRPWILKGLAAICVLSLFVGAARLYSLDADRLTDITSLTCLALGCGLILFYIRTAKRESKFGKWSLLYGLILLASVFMRPLQISLYEANWLYPFSNGVIGLVELSTLSPFIIPATVACVVARIGHTVYLLGSDVDVDLEMEGKLNIFQRKLKRLNSQDVVVGPMVLLFALCAVIVQSQPLQDYLDHRDEKILSFSSNGNEVELRGIPTDGRVVRVAIVENKPEGPPLGDDKTSSPDAFSDFTRSLQDGGLVPIEAKSVRGDIWLSFQDGEIQVWWTSPIKCLEASRASGDTVTFDLHSICSYESKVRLVAVLYDKRRSDFLKGMLVEQGEQANVYNVVNSSDSWLLIDTFSPFVKSVWSPVF